MKMIQNSRELLIYYPFLSSFLIGAIFIVSLRLIFPGTGGAILAVMVATAAIILLGLYYYRNQVKDLLRAGDELYYLGLLFTLVSLSYALVSLFIINPNAVDLEQRTNDLIGSFGIALASTIIGILARILLQGLEGNNQERSPSPGKPDPDSNEDILFLRLQLREAGDAFSHFTRMTLNQAQQTALNCEELIEEFNRRMRSDFKGELDNTVTSWREVLREVGEQSQQLMSNISRLAQDIFEHIEKNWSALSKNIESISLDTQAQLKTSSTTLSRLLEHISAASHSLNNLVDGLNTTAGEVAKLGHTATDVSKKLSNSSTEIANEYSAFSQDFIESIKTNWSALFENLESMSLDFQAQLKTNSITLSKLLEHIDAAGLSLNNLDGGLNTTAEEVAKLGHTVTDVTAKLDSNSTEIVNGYEAFTQDTQLQRGIIQRKGEDVQESISILLNSINLINHSLDTIAANLETAEQHTGRMKENAENTITELSQRTQQIVNSYDGIGQRAEDQEEIQRHISELRGSIESLATIISKFISSIDQQKSRSFLRWKN